MDQYHHDLTHAHLAAKLPKVLGQKDEMVDSNENYKLCCMCEKKPRMIMGKKLGFKNECAKKGDGPASQCVNGKKCDKKVKDGFMCVLA